MGGTPGRDWGWGEIRGGLGDGAVKTLGAGVEELRRAGRGLGCSPEWAGWRESCTHAAAAPGCLGPWDMAAPGSTWNADVWPNEGRPSCWRRGRSGSPGMLAQGAWGGPIRWRRRLEGGRPRILCWGIAQQEARAHRPGPGRGPAPPPGPPRSGPPSGPRVPRLFLPLKKLSRTSRLPLQPTAPSPPLPRAPPPAC